MTSAAMTFDELPLALTSFLERESWLRVAASAYRPDHTVVSRAEIDRRLTLDGQVTYLRAGEEFRIVEPSEFDRFRSDMLVQIAKAFGGVKR